VDIERRIDSDMAVRRLVDSWLSRAVAGLRPSSDDDPEARSGTGQEDGPGSRHNDPDDDPGPESSAASDDGHR
jgi:hypothetical protein